MRLTWFTCACVIASTKWSYPAISSPLAPNPMSDLCALIRVLIGGYVEHRDSRCYPGMDIGNEGEHMRPRWVHCQWCNDVLYSNVFLHIVER